jgi:hypothetical protein
MKLGKLLSSKGLLTPELTLIDYHVNRLNTYVEDFEDDFPEIKEKNDLEKAEFLVNLYKDKLAILKN